MQPWRLLPLVVIALSATTAAPCLAADATTGPTTENRFPPLKVPPGFKSTLFACDPLIEYPSAISAGPRPGAIFVAVDYMTGLGTEITRKSEVRLVEDSDSDGYADKATAFADGLNSIMGLAWHDNALYVMHAPFLTVLRDFQGTGVAGERIDIVTGLGLTPEENPVRLHCANGVTVGHDGWLYLSLGDNGAIVERPEGDRLVLEGGGILRCRPDGRNLHVFSMGLRNIYDVALDAELNVFTRDNENDGGDYKIRVCHSFFGADHGYPYLYYERPDEALAPIADLGLGSSAGGVCYLEQQFPAEYRGGMFFCEWGKSLVYYPLERQGSSFATPPEVEFAVGAEGDPYGFKPTDVVVQRDGTLMVADYADGQRPMRGRGRIYHIAFAGAQVAPTPPGDPLEMLNSESYVARCDAQAPIELAGEKGLSELTSALAAGRIGPRGRLHAVWIMAHKQGAAAIKPLLEIAKSDPDPSVRAQAVRAVADLVDPVLADDRSDAESGAADMAAQLAALAVGQDSRVVLEAIVALGRIRWAPTAEWLEQNLVNPDPALAHAAMITLRKSGQWSTVLRLLDLPSESPLRGIALRAAAGQFHEPVVDELLHRLPHEKESTRLLEYADWLARVYKKPGPWTYWGYRPPPRPANEVAWSRTEAIAAGLNAVLRHENHGVRLAGLRHMQRAKVEVRIARLAPWLREDRDPERIAAVLDAMRDQPAEETWLFLPPLIRDSQHSEANRLAAIAIFAQGLNERKAAGLLAMTEGLEDGPVLAASLRLLGAYPKLASAPLLAGKVDSPVAEVRAAAIEALGKIGAQEGRSPLSRLLRDDDAQVRRAAAIAAQTLGGEQAIESLLGLTADADAQVRVASLESLCVLKEPRVVPLAVAALGDRDCSRAALAAIRAVGGPGQAGALIELAKRDPSLEILETAVQTLVAWRDRPETDSTTQHQLDDAVATIQGASGSLIRWTVAGADGADETRFAAGIEGRVTIAPPGNEGTVFRAWTEIAVSEPAEVEFLASTSGDAEFLLNGESIHLREQPQEFRIDSDRFSATLAAGNNRLELQTIVSSPATPVEFHVRFRRKSAIAEHERLAQAVIAGGGDAERGRAVLQSAEKSLCLKCHRVADQGERIGPELSGLGSRFSRIYIAESILAPGRAIASSFHTWVLLMNNGQVLSGVKVAEDETTITLADNQGQKQTLKKDDIEDQKASPLSTMPDALEKRLSEQEFVDLVAFLASLKETP